MDKLWVDDIRPPPDATWTAVDNVWDATLLLRAKHWDLVSLDHDMGWDEDTRGIVEMWINEPELWPDKILVHSANPVGAAWLRGTIERYKP